MTKNNENFDVVVIGGGPAGMMAAIRAAQLGASVILLEKNKTLGVKLLLTGNGRCNITHKEKDSRVFSQKFGKEGDFLLSPLSIFNSEHTMEFFEENGLQLKTEAGNNVFPDSDKAKDVLSTLLLLLKKNNVKVATGADVSKINEKNGKIESISLFDGKEIKGASYVLCAGGKSYPVTGSDGGIFAVLKRLGHDVVTPKPALTPVEIKESWVSNLQGLALKGVKVSVVQNGKAKLSEQGDLMFTHFGLGGPLILDMSRAIGDMLEKDKIKLAIDLMPGSNQEEAEKKIQALIDKNKSKHLENVLKDLVPDKLVQYIIYFSGVEKGKKGFDVKREDRQKIVKVIKRIEITVVGLLGFDRAMATHGGVSLKEIDSKMKSKIIDNLYFAGEIINLDGPCGGYNLQLCWTTGYVAGQSAASGVKCSYD